MISTEQHRNISEEARQQLEEIRKILVDPELSELDVLRERIQKLEGRGFDLSPAKLSEILPDSIVLRAQTDKRLTQSLVPVVEDAISESINNNRTKLADLLFPVIGPAIRKAIAQTLKSLLQASPDGDKVISSYSAQGIKWRLEAIRSGRSYTEVVLRHTLVYRVEQVFLIHKETGILLQHVVADDIKAEHGDLVSGMLTAIQNFVHDSFASEQEGSLEIMEVGDLTILIEEGPYAVVAGVVRGTFAPELRTVFQEAIENIHFEQQKRLSEFEGNTDGFETTKPHLERCLQSDYKSKDKTTSKTIQTIQRFALPVLLIGVLAFFSVRDHWRWSNFLAHLENEPGIIVTDSYKGWFSFWGWSNYHVTGLRDPEAINPETLMTTFHLPPEQLNDQWEAYQALDKSFLLKRAIAVLNPPASISLEINDDYILTPKGSANHEWIETAKQSIKTISGIKGLDATHLERPEWLRIQALKNDLEARIFFFDDGVNRLSRTQTSTIGEAVIQLQDLLENAKKIEQPVTIHLTGHADQRGDNETNEGLSLNRANVIKRMLVNEGVDESIMHTEGAGTSRPIRKGTSEEDLRYNRSVTFRIELE